MIILHPNGRIEQVPDLPSDYECEEWKAYDALFDEAMDKHRTTKSDFVFTDAMKEAYGAYQEAMKRKAQAQEREH